MAVTFRSTSQTIGTGTSPTVAEPASAVNGDYLVAFAEVDTVDITPPTGWTNLFGGQKTQGTVRYLANYIARGASAPNLTWTFTGTVYREVTILCLKTSGGTISLDSQSAAGTSGTDTGTTTQPNPPATTAVATSSLAVCMGNNTVGSSLNSITAPTGYTLRSADPNGTDSAMADKSLSAAGSEDPGAFSGFTAGSNSAWWHGGTATFTDVTATTFVPYQPWYALAPTLAQ